MRVFIFSIVWVLLIIMPGSGKSQETEKKAEWLPKGNLFPTLRFDFKESQFSGGLYGLHVNRKWQDRVFAVFSAGIRRNIVRWHHDNHHISELGVDICVFPQFLFEKPFETFSVNFFNLDFKAGLHYQYQINDHWRLRGRLYHVSAHLGDDYIFKYEIDHYATNYRIYEMLDFSGAWLKKPFMVYGTIGCLVHCTYARPPLFFQLGGQWNRVSKKISWFQWIAGIDIRCEQMNHFRPNIHTGAGFVLGKPDRFPITILIDYYNGTLPYSLYDDVYIQWIGASLYFDVF